jgi:hypothetical protein
MKTKLLPDDSWAFPKETPAEQAARRRKLHAILKKGTGLKPGELKNAIRPGYLETYRAMVTMASRKGRDGRKEVSVRCEVGGRGVKKIYRCIS